MLHFVEIKMENKPLKEEKEAIREREGEKGVKEWFKERKKD